MKKQINPNTKAHLIRSAFYVLLLLAVCVIPFALAQRNTPKRSAATEPRVAANKAQLAAQLERAKSVPTSLIGKRQLAPQRKSARADAQLRNDVPAVPWTLAASVAIDHYGGFMDSDGTFAYEGGGYSFSAPGTINQFGRFDPVANTWTPLAAVPDLINAEASGVYAPNVNKLFVFGGDDPDSGTVVNTTRIYDIATDTWTSGAPMPDLRAFMGSGYFNGKIYLVGGYSTGNVDPSFGQVWEYDPVANTFDTSRASMPATLGGPGFGIINGHIYIAGGRDLNNTNLNTLYDYDIVANTWTQRANLPTGMNVPGSAVIGGQLWVFGGGNPFLGSGTSPKSSKKAVLAPDTSNILQIYDPVTDTWTSGPNLNHLRAFPAGTHVGDTAVAVGGYDGAGTTASVEINGTTGGTPTPTPTGTPSGCVVSGSIDTGDPTQTDRLFRSGVPQTCPPSTTCATFGDGLPHHYDEYTFTNTTGSTQCVTVDTDTACTGTNFIFIASYLGSFDPANICTNWIGDSGSSPDIGVPAPYQFNLDDGQTVVIVVSEVTPDAGCAGYTVTVSGICGGGVSPTPTASPTCIPGSPNGAAGPWTAGTAYPTTIVRYGFVQTATHFYVFGGVDNGATTSAVNRMDLSTGNWEPRAAMPFSGEAPTCALDASTGIAYCADGFATNAFAAYDTNTDTWTPLAPDPFVTDHYGAASGAFNGKVYVVGGTSGFSNAVWIYDIATNSWSLGTSAPTGPFELAGYTQVGQFLYVVGGYDTSFVNLNTTLRLDMSSAPGTWETGPTFTPQLADFGLAFDPGTNTLYSLGGDLPNDGNPFNSTAQVNELDVSGWPGGTWNPSPPDLPAPPRQAAQAGFFGNGDIWAVGGINGATFQFLNEVWHRNNGGGGGCPSPTPTVTPP